MGGDILVRSTVGQGSEFCVCLMLKPDTREHGLNECDAVVPDYRDLKGLKILVVEDVVLNQILMQELLHKQGVHTTIAENGLLAVEAVNNDTSIDMVLMDVQMPVMDGYEATRQIRITNTNIPIIGMTANAMDSDIKACLDAGMNAHVAKPVDPIVFLRTLLNNCPKNI